MRHPRISKRSQTLSAAEDHCSSLFAADRQTAVILRCAQDDRLALVAEPPWAAILHPQYPSRTALDLQIVAFFTVLSQVQALNLLLGRNPQADHHIHHLQNDERAGNRQDPCNGHAHELVEELMGIAVD